jgi:hypothetical protein
MTNKAMVHSLGHAVLVLIYVTLIATVMSHGEALFGKKDTAWTPVAVLMLFVLSAAVTGTLVLGRPVLMYVNGEKKEAIQFFGYTIAWLAALTVLVFLVMIVWK